VEQDVHVVSPDESIKIFTLAVVLVTYHLTKEDYLGVQLNAWELSEMVNAIPGNDQPDYYVDPLYLGHALLQFCQILTARNGVFQWEIETGRALHLKASAVGLLAQSSKGCLVRLLQVKTDFAPYIMTKGVSSKKNDVLDNVKRNKVRRMAERLCDEMYGALGEPVELAAKSLGGLLHHRGYYAMLTRLADMQLQLDAALPRPPHPASVVSSSSTPALPIEADTTLQEGAPQEEVGQHCALCAMQYIHS
jgi:hypothetical protein